MITAEDMAKEIRKHHKFWPTMTDEAQARIIIDFIQSRAAGVQGVDLTQEAVAEAMKRWPDAQPAIIFMAGAVGALAPITANDIAWANTQTATPQPPKDAGAVAPTREDIDAPYFNRMREADQAAAACEAAGRADAVPSFNREHAAKRIADSILRSPTNSIDENNDSVALLDVLANAFGDKTVGPAMDWMIDAVFEALKDFPQHPPAEPASRVQEAVGGISSEPIGHEIESLMMNHIEVFLDDPSPATSCAGDAEKWSDSDIAKWAEQMAESTTKADGETWYEFNRADMLAFARRLVGGKA